jgi:transposase-like protein
LVRELSVTEQRYQAVLAVIEDVEVTAVAKKFGVSRQTVHTWLSRYAAGGLAELHRAAVADHHRQDRALPRHAAPRAAHRPQLPQHGGIASSSSRLVRAVKSGAVHYSWQRGPRPVGDYQRLLRGLLIMMQPPGIGSIVKLRSSS